MTFKRGLSFWQQFERIVTSPPNKIAWGPEGDGYSGISRTPSGELSSSPPNLRMTLVVTVREEAMTLLGLDTVESVVREAFGAVLGPSNITIQQAHYEPLHNFYKLRGDMDRLGTITPEGITAFENDGEVQGSLAVKVHISDDKVKLDLHIVDQAGVILARWEGVEVIDDTQVTWCFSDTGNIKISMEPILEPA